MVFFFSHIHLYGSMHGMHGKVGFNKNWGFAWWIWLSEKGKKEVKSISQGPIFFSPSILFLINCYLQKFPALILLNNFKKINLFMHLFICLCIYVFIYLWLHWVFVAVHQLSLVAAGRDYSSLQCVGFSLQWLLLLWSRGSRCMGFSSCGVCGLSSCGSQALEHRLSSCGARA